MTETLDARALYDAGLQIIESVILMDRVDSTMNPLLHAARECQEADQALPPTVLFALEQTAGAGRDGRVWSSPPGGLYSALALRTTRERAATMPLEMGVVAARTARRLGATNASIKWPNDLYCGDAKLGGLLIRARVARDSVDLVVGIGINLTPIDSVDRKTTSIEQESGRPVSLEEARRSLVLELDKSLSGALHVNELIGEWRELAIHQPGDAIVFRTGEELVEGGWIGIEGDGRARLSIDGTERAFSSGEIIEWLPSDLEDA